MIVILVVALLVVGPDKLPDLARSMAKWTVEMKRTVNDLKDSLTEEENAIGSAHPDLKGNLPDTEPRAWQAADKDGREGGAQNGEILEMDDFQPPSSEELSNAISAAAAVSDSETSESDSPVAAVSGSETSGNDSPVVAVSDSETSDSNPPAAEVSDSKTFDTQNGPDKNKVAADDSHPSPAHLRILRLTIRSCVDALFAVSWPSS